jgi:hypothetical protein
MTREDLIASVSGQEGHPSPKFELESLEHRQNERHREIVHTAFHPKKP